jgi:hypothetical protein
VAAARRSYSWGDLSATPATLEDRPRVFYVWKSVAGRERLLGVAFREREHRWHPRTPGVATLEVTRTLREAAEALSADRDRRLRS